MSHWTARWNVLLNRTATVGRESWQLLHGFVTTQGQFKQTLLDQTRLSNQTATTILQMDKEFGLLRYHGLPGYLREKDWLPKSIDWNQKYSSDNKLPSQPNQAKVAFMVTSSMRKELNEELGYEADKIKTMTPLEASLIIQHKLSPAEQSERLPVLVQQHEAAVQEEAKKQAEQAEQERLEQERLQREQQAATKDAQQATKSSQPKSARASFASDNIMDDPSYAEQRNKTQWYEVIETNKEDGTTNVIGLYLSEKEAQIGMDTLELFANRNAHEKGQTSSPYSFEIRISLR